MTLDSIYVDFSKYVETLSNINDFKSHPDFTNVLEHVSFNQGIQYLDLIKNKTPLSQDDIIAYCKINDKIGGGEKYNYDFITTSPTNFRYLFQAHLIITHLFTLNLTDVNIVEVGCGYGGLCLAINHLSNTYNIKIKIKSYNLIDLPSLSKLQQLYLKEHQLNFTTNFHSAFNYGADIEQNELFLISNYCFSEISSENQQKYINTLFPKVSHGFMAWNYIPVYNFGFDYVEETEYPLTGTFNKYVYF